ncbi:MAG: hypothetical protein KW804_00040 [Candidatus Doudnabacteria bacterium]|nr:hypothetical protein [Candidatus Doudnabacteria bacterium]
MSKRTIISLIILLLVVAGIVWFAVTRDKETATPVLSVTATNQTQNRPANEADAIPQDLIVYTLSAENQSDDVIEGYIMEANISEITDKASLVDANGAAYNAGTNSLVWTPLDIPANESITKEFSVRVNPLASGTSSSDMKIKFNNEISIHIIPAKVAGTVTPVTPTYVAPTSGPSSWMPALFAVLITASYFAIRKYRLSRV